MRKIELRTMEFSDVLGGTPPNMTTASALKQIVGGPKAEGLLIDEMRRCTRILEAIESAAEKPDLFLEEADWQYLKSRVQGHRFPFPAQAFVDLCDAVENPPHIDPNKPEEKPPE